MASSPTPAGLPVYREGGGGSTPVAPRTRRGKRGRRCLAVAASRHGTRVLSVPWYAAMWCRNGKKKLGVSNTPYDGGRWVTNGSWWVTDGGWWVTDGSWWVTDGGWWVTNGSWWVTDGGWWVTDGGWWVTGGGWWVTDGSWWVTDGGWWVTNGGWWVTDGGWWVTDGGWWVATKHQRVDAIVKKKKGERPYGTP